MAKQGKETYESYAKDMFDNPPAGPMGVHRGARSAASRAMPYVIVVIVSLLAGLLFWGIYSGEAGNLKMPWVAKESSSTSSASTGKKSEGKSEAASGDTDKNKNQTSDSSNAQSGDATDSDQNDGQNSDQDTDTNQSVNLSTQIRVVNATNITGYAKSKADALTQAGYTSVTADNPTGNVPSQTVVWYQNEADKATAENVAQTLNIANVEQSSTLTTPIVVVLLN
ncbi:LytR C-terminal domain-containing protein [Bifidobacterium ruminantium]|uniref:LytR C-terminal domain-containing protein n=1 Tax=Bifidobacterium ruminantium TaxID=78346 RepID=UPI0019560005|nr:LytR C-terminal domain-containing protein [Bifidobacterium ruminantium]MBM6745954.1 LytR C-terminal domain-containing protein [Bifidobacterium ruminantium]